MAQSCLEIRSMDARHTQIVRSDYQAENRYGNVGANMVTIKDLTMKGRNDGGHTHWLPDCHATVNTFLRFNFDTDPASNLGNLADQAARNASMVRSVYNALTPYGNVDTSANILEGQYYIN